MTEVAGTVAEIRPVKISPEPAQEDARQFISDNDSLYVMTLRIVPFKTLALRRGRLIRNAQFKPAVEVYQSGDGTSGQILIEDVTPEIASRYFGWETNKIHPDYALLHKIARLTSYDIYSLRILFRDPDTEKALQKLQKLADSLAVDASAIPDPK